MKKNCETFEDTEENKLEYTNVYTEYVHILDQMIDAQLKTIKLTQRRIDYCELGSGHDIKPAITFL